MNRPHISFVMPTRNRPLLASQTVGGILTQDYHNLEVIVVDNSDNFKTRDIINNIRDKRLTIQSTGGLSMPENWDYALRQAQGDYVVILNDKTIYRKGSISRMASILNKEKPDFLTWVIGGGESQEIKESSEPIKVDNWSVINYALECRIDKYQRLAPRGTNSAIKNELLTSLRKKHGNLCRPVSPDYSLSVFVLTGGNNNIHLSEKLAYVIPGAPSNTEETKNTKSSNEGYLSTLKYDKEKICSFVKCKVDTINNLLLNDILESLCVSGVKNPKINFKEYYLMLFSDIIISTKQKYPCLDRLHQVMHALNSEKISFRVQWFFYIFYRFYQGYPSRNLKMRQNLPDFLLLLKMLFLKDTNSL